MDCPATSIDSGNNFGDTLATWDTARAVLLSLAFVLLATTVLLESFLLPSRRKTRSGAGRSLEQELLTHVVITGGSSGIGLSIARECIERGARVVTLLARNPEKLAAAKKELEALSSAVSGASEGKKQRCAIEVVAVDVSDQPGIVRAARDVCTSQSHPVPTSLLNVAGTSSSAAFVDTDYSEFRRLMDINYMGTAYATRAFLPYMLEDSGGIRPRAIVFTSSQAGQLGIYGYTAYSASKFALRGLAEALHMELAPRNVSVQVVFPPDTDTPGFEIENLDKPAVTRVISETSGLFSPEAVAKALLDSMAAKRPAFGITIGLDGFMLGALTAGMSPCVDGLGALYQIFLAGLFRFVSLFYLWDFRRTVARMLVEEEQKKEKNE
ncbi:unnamed protein product [Pseudo-nitzschia multistriata]|uniref:3-dehydrosphinganine reductase n=1 Tax=Pseudo-nitzschia multistriata TaxID=183589 RepID=A0A448ZGL4_9STRA|nr:unnamed protein product [Pseudo-nitzschia multistriata]